jgi:lipoprotein-releasing system permease protein
MDNKLVVVPFSWAESIFEREGYATAVEVATRPGTDNKEVVQSIKNLMGDQVVIYNRYEQNRAVYKMFNTEKWVSFSLMAFVLLLISFNLVGSLSMLVLEKKKDIALLNHIGMRLGAIQGIFFREGLMVSLVGTGIGLSLGVMLVLLQQKFGFITTQSTMAAVAKFTQYTQQSLILSVGAWLVIHGELSI